MSASTRHIPVQGSDGKIVTNLPGAQPAAIGTARASQLDDDDDGVISCGQCSSDFTAKSTDQTLCHQCTAAAESSEGFDPSPANMRLNFAEGLPDDDDRTLIARIVPDAALSAERYDIVGALAAAANSHGAQSDEWYQALDESVGDTMRHAAHFCSFDPDLLTIGGRAALADFCANPPAGLDPTRIGLFGLQGSNLNDRLNEPNGALALFAALGTTDERKVVCGIAPATAYAHLPNFSYIEVEVANNGTDRMKLTGTLRGHDGPNKWERRLTTTAGFEAFVEPVKVKSINLLGDSST